jgi:geranylgeranyl pyrophosphate synthase
MTTPPSPSLSVSDILRLVPGLPAVEQLIASKFTSDAPRLAEISDYLFRLGGKRLRPSLTLLVAKAFGMKEPAQSLIDVAAGIELIHMATLLHDDIIDGSPVRRHHPSPYAAFGTNDTLLTGDFLLTRAFSLCARLDPFIIDATEEACIHLTEGEILETPLFLSTHSLASSRTIAEKKTAALFRLGARSAGFLCGLRNSALDSLAQFGNYLGIAFQMLDDLLDVISPEERLGKRPGTDIRERKPSIVNMLWLATNTPLSQRLSMRPEQNEEPFINEALAEIANSPIINQARDYARAEALSAQAALQEAARQARLADMPVCDEALSSLQLIIAYTLERME